MLSSRPAPPALRPPPNTPSTPTFPTSFPPFTLVTSYEDTSSEDEDGNDTDPHVLSSYGLLSSPESYIPPPSLSAPSPLSSSPGRYPHGCLRLRTPIRRPPLPNRTHGGWSCPRVVIGGCDSGPSSPVTPTPTVRTKPVYPGYLRSSPSSPIPSRPLPSPNSPAPLPILLRPLPSSQSALDPLPARNRSTTSDPMSDSETEVELDVEEDKELGETSSSDTCASDSDSDGVTLHYPHINGRVRVRAATLKPKSRTKLKPAKRPPIPRWDSSAEDLGVERAVLR